MNGAVGPECRRAIAEAVLRGVAGRHPDAVTVAMALRGTGSILDAAALAEHVARSAASEPAPGCAPQPPQMLADHGELDALRAEIARLRASLSWRLTGPMRAAVTRMPTGLRRGLRSGARSLYRAGRGRPVLPPERIALPEPPVAQPSSVLQSVDEAAARVNAANWCVAQDAEVSIIIVNWNAAALTAECVRHVWANTVGTRYEILIADNGSGEADRSALRDLGPGVRLLELGTNRFFGEANNIAVEQAQGRYICFLNNDAFVRESWLPPLIAALRDDPSTGAAGPKFLFPDGRLQEAGVMMNALGFPERRGRFGDPADPAFNHATDVDYVSAAALLLSRADFIRAAGFELAYEPAYYEDSDLCLKLRCLGKTVRYVPESEVVHIEGASTTDAAGEARRKALGDLNRGKFVARWGDFLSDRSDATLARIAPSIIPGNTPSHAMRPHPARPRAAILTPFMLTPGGGERVILTLASVLSATHDVEIVTTHPYSVMRLGTLGRDFGIDLSRCRLVSVEDRTREGTPDPDLCVTLGNHVLPPTAGFGRRNWYICQFPFPMGPADAASWRGNLGSYDLVLTYSAFARDHVLRACADADIRPVPTEILYPPVTRMSGDPRRKKPMILSVGRFIAGGHAKRQDVMLDTFRTLAAKEGGVDGLELHLAGSSFPMPADMDYLAGLQDAASDLPVKFHVNPSPEALAELYRDAAIYWHATGYGLAPDAAAERAEHFGITIVEAMSAGCVPFAYAAGGPCEIIRDGETGFLFRSLDVLADGTAALLSEAGETRRIAFAESAAEAARAFSLAQFSDRVLQLAAEDVYEAATERMARGV